MVMTSRAERVSAAFVRITDTLVADHEVPDLLQALVDSTVDLLGCSAACLVLADPQGRLRVVAPRPRQPSRHRTGQRRHRLHVPCQRGGGFRAVAELCPVQQPEPREDCPAGHQPDPASLAFPAGPFRRTCPRRAPHIGLSGCPGPRQRTHLWRATGRRHHARQPRAVSGETGRPPQRGWKKPQPCGP